MHFLCLLFATVALTRCAFANTACPISGADIRFQPPDVYPRSFFYQQGQEATISRNQNVPRFVIQVIDSNGNLDPTINGVEIRASSSDPSVALSGISAQVYQGEAHFTNLQVEFGQGLNFIFQAYSRQFGVTLNEFNQTVPNFLPLNGKSIRTGQINVLLTTKNVFSIGFSRTDSIVRYANQSVTFVSGAPLPPIQVHVLDSAYRVYDTSIELGGNYTITASFADPPPEGTSLFGNSLPVTRGVAIFDSLTITAPQSASVFPELVFSLNVDPVLIVRTANLTQSKLFDFHHIAFETEDKSFIYSEELDLSAQGGAGASPLPRVQISIRNTLYKVSPPSTGLIITAHCARARLSGNVVGVVNGLATFDSLTFEDVLHDDFRPYVISFTAGNQGGLRLKGEVLVTGWILVKRPSDPAYSMRFLQSSFLSFFNARGQPAQVVEDNVLNPEVQIELLQSSGDRDTTTKLVEVTVREIGGLISSAQSTRTQEFKSGIATFSDLRLKSVGDGSSMTLVFTASGASYHVNQQELLTGLINVTNVENNYDMRFQPYGASLFTLPLQPSFATIDVKLPPIVIELISSANTVDSDNDDIGITATADGAVLSGSFMRVQKGVAVFSDLTFVSDVTGAFRITFTAGNEGVKPVAGKTLSTGPIDVVASVTPRFRPMFRNDSYIVFPGHSVPITLGVPIPDIIVEVQSSIHTLNSTVLSGRTSPLVADVTISNGFFSTDSKVDGISIVDDVCRISGLVITSAFNPVLTVCLRSRVVSVGDVDPAEGQCISSGPLSASSVVDAAGTLKVLNASMSPFPVNLEYQYSPLSITKGTVLQMALGLFDTAGNFVGNGRGINIPLINVEVRNVFLAGSQSDLRKSINTTTGIVYFNNLVLDDEMPLSVTPILTVTGTADASVSTPVRLNPISSPIITVAGAARRSGVDVVAEVLFDVQTFSFATWRAAVARRLHIEIQRIIELRVFAGTSADADPDGVSESTTEKQPKWKGTRVDLRFLPKLPTSRDTKTPEDLAAFFVNLEPSCKIGELFLRKAYLAKDEVTCDWYIFDDQMNGVRSCIQARGKSGYCDCHVPLFTFMGARCLGLPRLTSLCLNILINRNSADCKNKEIEDVCKKLEFPDAPRTGLVASGAFLALFFPPIWYLWFRGFFHKINRPGPSQTSIPTMETGGRDAHDFL